MLAFRLPTSNFQWRPERTEQHAPFFFARETSKSGSLRSAFGRGVLATLAAVLGSPALAFGQVTNQIAPVPNVSLGLPDAGFSVLRLLGGLVLVLSLFLAGVWVFKYWQRVAVYKGRQPRLRILEVKPLGNRQALYVVAYDQQRLLLSSSASGVQLITNLPEADEEEVEVPVPAFAETLQQAFAAKS